jgi:hypothetical protein
MYPPRGDIKDIKKGSGLGRIVRTNDLLRVKPQ